MNDFRSCYQSAVQDMNMLGMKEFHIDASLCMDESRHKKRMVKRMRRVTATAFSAMCLVFLCGFGTVKAAEYIENVIKVNDWGFESADAATMAENEGTGNTPYIIGEEIARAEQEEPGPSMTKEQEEKLLGTRNEVVIVKEADVEKALAEATYTDSASASGVQTNEIPVKSYESWEEFEKNEDIVFPQPSIYMEGNIKATNITVCGEWAMVRYIGNGKVFWMERTDYADTRGHASSKVFPGGVSNERSYTTPQGYSYTLVDSNRNDIEEPLQIHAAATVGSYEVYIDFMGYTQKEAESVMDSVDLSLYE